MGPGIVVMCAIKTAIRIPNLIFATVPNAKVISATVPSTFQTTLMWPRRVELASDHTEPIFYRMAPFLLLFNRLAG